MDEGLQLEDTPNIIKQTFCVEFSIWKSESVFQEFWVGRTVSLLQELRELLLKEPGWQTSADLES